jgi:hypothetical protein
MVSPLASKWQGLEICQLFYEIKLKTFLFKVLVFEDREDIMTKFKSQALHVKKKSNIENPVEVATLPPSFLPSGT